MYANDECRNFRKKDYNY